MKPNDEKILMVLLNEANQKDIDEVLSSTDKCAQLDQLEADMQIIEEAQNDYDLPVDYGQKLWHKIADELESPIAPPENWWHKLQSFLLQPKYSLASFAMLGALVLAAFLLGRGYQSGGLDRQLQEQLLAQNIQLHLTQSEIFLTQVSNSSGTNNMQATAQRLLTSNRIFKQALSQHKGHFTQQILQNLEPVLLEYANKEYSPIHDQQSGFKWVGDNQSSDLLFQVKAMKQQLAQQNDII